MLLKTSALSYAAGTLGGLINSLTVWATGAMGITAALDVQLAPAFTPAWLYPRLVWGGLWGLLFLLPVLRNSLLGKGLLLSLAPTLVQLFIVFPQAGKGMMGLVLGTLTPWLVLLFNLVWGLATAAALKEFGRP